ncbi:hypothetical protein [Rhizobium sp. NRK18]|uniref:hypothetical protein n=1 Tax=Rhizobium sp. NRK18 TaxID=2964667 RepID=UPI0021C40FD9|nr:hypothetical protein [Rhizobium sp. NRK18]MCQ2005263.1 hypothetical protein [Rhizobium sp. NRK18]
MPQDKTRVEALYRGHKIIAAAFRGEPTSAIYLGKSLATSNRFKGKTIEEALSLAKRWVDEKYSVTAANRPEAHIATIQEYVDALTARPPKDNEIAMLKAHATRQIMTATELAEAAGYQSFSSANLHYGTFGRDISEILHLTPKKRKDGTTIWTSVLADGMDADSDLSAEYRWQIHSELVEALKRLGIR